jgi:hypothetical protein
MKRVGPRPPTVPYVIAQCVFCKGERAVRIGEVPPGEQPICRSCFAPMVAVGAVRR